jgi:TetR/AcrR family transcriptional regulator, transcriptional repressor for nem operon
LLRYAALYAEVFNEGGRMCLCGVFALDAAGLSASTRQATAAFFGDQQQWVAGVFADAGLTHAAAARAAGGYLAALEGALLLARATRAEHTVFGVTDIAATLVDALL